ncbi:aspartate kinase [Aequorivita sp. CIP111184]|uniref:aspartate kinase n=1 Tax=Aequorivita sp. CIP111184 TaxID=2211356 RepID=UPI000DBBC78F|nr:aspartate kinase [Aequorivita sp. CIP111184]SRX52673.1 Lysine-sensitive aspartokinase 3 [Aequorivita sp. CIP111184]
MKIFKFGGASIKDAAGVKNVSEVLKITNEKNLVIVVSAMGKTTNLLEKVISEYLNDDTAKCKEYVSEFKEYHLEILKGLFENTNHSVYQNISELFTKMASFLDGNKSKNHAFVYDQVVSFGEMVSSAIVSKYLSEIGLKNEFLDVRKCIKTDASYRDANVDWEATQKEIQKKVNLTGITITQGFLGSETTNNFTTTLGREGSDYTAAIFAYCLNAESVTIWKDVPGVLNADPRYFTQTMLLNHISYREAIELAFYGASVIHPKTLQPLQRKEIPLYVKSFLDPTAPGTCVGKGVTLDPHTSCFILKKDLVLISLSSLDFSFMMEDNIGDVFKWLHKHKMKVEMIQNSAISFSVCVNDKFNNLEALLAKLREKFSVKWNENVTLYTIRHFNPTEVKALAENKNILLKQESKETVQLVIKE